MLKWTPHPILAIPTDEEIAAMEPAEVLSLYKAREEAIRNAINDPYRYGFRLPHWERAEAQMAEGADEILCLGGNRCLAPEQEIYDPASGRFARIDEWYGGHVEAWAGTRTVHAVATRSFRKTKQDIYEYTFDTGEAIRCSKSHMFLGRLGWVQAGDLRVGDMLSSPSCACRHQSNEEHSPSASLSDACRCSQKAQGSQFGCRLLRRFCGAQPPCESDSGQCAAPSQDDAQGHTSLSCGLSGDLDTTPGCSHPCCESARLSTLDVLRRFVALCVDIVCYVACKPCRPAWRSRVGLAPLPAFVQYEPASILRQSTGVFSLLGILWRCALAYRHPTYYRRVVKIDYLRNDYVWDLHVPGYNNYIAGGVISHNSGKTAFGSYACVRAAIENPGATIMCFAQNAEASVRQQQSAVYSWLPPEFRAKQTSGSTYISYTLKNGFTDNSLILPNKSQIIFKTYSQYQNNPTILEGAELGSTDPRWHNIGVWLDEYLLGEDLIGTLRFRLATRNAKMLVTFTPIDGWTEVIKDYLDKATTMETKEAELLGYEPVPYVQRSHKRNASIHYFHTKDNPFGGYDRLAKDLAKESREKILIRAYGVPVKSQATRFPKFNKEVNVIPQDMVPTKGITRYHIIDPAGSKNWFMAWIAVDGTGTYYVYREWPDVSVGDWAEWKGGKWVPGEGAKGLGYGIKDYVELIRELEGGEEIYERIIDPRLGAAKYQAQDGSSSIIEDLAENDMICIPAPGLDIEDGIQAIISKMAWDSSKPLDSVNRPKFYVTEECENTINAFSEYTGTEGLKEAWKDCVDCQRYAAVADIDHVDPKNLRTTRTHIGGY